jgi:hypothetical protein
VATHEFGHSLGLEHTNNTAAVMYFAYEYRSDFKLDKDDIEGVQVKLHQNENSTVFKLIQFIFFPLNDSFKKNAI